MIAARAGAVPGAPGDKVMMMTAKVLTCPSCTREGVAAPQSLDEYYIWHKRSTGIAYRSKYCKRHESQRQNARAAERHNPQSPKYDREQHERRKKRMREYAAEQKAKRQAQ